MPNYPPTEPFIMVPVSVAFDATLSPYAVRLFAALEHFSGQHMTCWPGYTALAALVGCTPRWIPVLLGKLVKAGLLAVQSRPGKSSIYTLLKRVSRQPQPRPTPEVKAEAPMNSNSYEQKQAPKTNSNSVNTWDKRIKKAGAAAFIQRELARKAKKRG